MRLNSAIIYLKFLLQSWTTTPNCSWTSLYGPVLLRHVPAPFRPIVPLCYFVPVPLCPCPIVLSSHCRLRLGHVTGEQWEGGAMGRGTMGRGHTGTVPAIITEFPRSTFCDLLILVRLQNRRLPSYPVSRNVLKKLERVLSDFSTNRPDSLARWPYRIKLKIRSVCSLLTSVSTLRQPSENVSIQI